MRIWPMVFFFPVLVSISCGGGEETEVPDTSTVTPTQAPATPTPTWPVAFDDCAPWQSEDYHPIATPEDAFWEGAIIYQVWVRSFSDGAKRDGLGDLDGIRQKLDYIESLGTSILWLSPTFPSPSDHGYDVLDFSATRDLYGGDDALDLLISEAGARGIEILLDVPINHTSSSHAWFLASTAADAPERDDYLWANSHPGYDGWHRYDSSNYYYGHFWSGMPDLNYGSRTVRDEITAALQGWMDRGIKAFRIDAARHLVEEGDIDSEHPGTYCTLRGIRQQLAKSTPDVLLIGEVWTSTKTIGTYLDDGKDKTAQSDLLPLAYDFPIAENILGSVSRGNTLTLLDIHKQRARFYPDPAMGVSFLSNHDQDRVASQIGTGLDRLKLAAGTLFSVPGPVVIYYGEEIGMTGKRTASDNTDNSRRSPMQWTSEAPGYGFSEVEPWYPVNDDVPTINVAAQSEDDDSLLSFYRDLAAQRLAHPALATGDITLLTSSEASVYGVVRQEAGETILILANFSDTTIEGKTLDLSEIWGEGGFQLGATLLGAGGEPVFTLGAETHLDLLPPRGIWFIELEALSEE